MNEPIIESKSPSEPDVVSQRFAHTFFAGGGEMGRRIREFDWSQTPLGAIGEWPQSLKTVVRIMLDSRYAMWMGWGRDLTFFYNDAYARDTLGKKHPWALSRPASRVWAEIWAEVGPRIEHVFKTGEATWDEGLLLFLERSGYPEETYHTFSYSPLYDDTGQRAGLFCVVTEETNRVIAERRVELLRDFASALTASKTESDVFKALEHCLSNDGRDLPFTLTYLFDNSPGKVRLAACTGLDRSHPAALDGEMPSPVWDILRNTTPRTVSDLHTRFAELPVGPWPSAPKEALLLPIAQQGQARPAGVFIAGLNPHRSFGEDYRGFINLLVGQIATAIANVRAAEEQRRRAEALAELDRAKTTFFSNISHELRTPLTLMLGPIEDILNKPESEVPPGNRELITVAHRNALRLLKLVNTLLDFSRIEAGRIQALYEPVDLATYTTDLASVFRSAMEKAGLKLSIDCPPLPQPVFVDRDLWEKLVLNLLSNAFKFTFEGGVTVALHWWEDEVRLTVRDTGVGIPESELPRLFERFHRVRGTKSRNYEGTGIGLALVRELARLHGGNVQVESREGVGTTFTVSIKTGVDHLPADSVSRSGEKSSTRTSAVPFIHEAMRWVPNTSGATHDSTLQSAQTGLETRSLSPQAPRVLLADDNADMRDYVRRLLAGRYHVEAVADGEAALESIRARRPDVVLTDVMMPRRNGFELLSALRSQPDTRAIPVIMLSARAGEEARVEGLDAGADDYLIKPFSARELLARVASQLEINRLRREREEEVTRILESIADGFQALDANWRFTYMNTAARRMLEGQHLEAEDLIGKHFFDEAFPQARGTTIESQYRRAMEERVAVQFEHFYKPWQRWYSVRAYPIAQGGITIYFRDITTEKRSEEAVRLAGEQLKRQLGEVESVNAELREARRAALNVMEDSIEAQDALRKSEERFRAYVVASSDVVYSMGPDWKEMRHLQGREFIADTVEPSRTWLDKYIRPDDQSHVLAVVDEAIRARSTFQLEHRVIRVDGTLGWIFSRAVPLLNDKDEILEWFGAASDVTQRKEAEERVAALRRLYHAILSTTPDLAYVFDLNHRFVYANDALLSMWGRSWDQAIGKTCLELGYEAWHAEMHDREIEQVIATKKPIRGEVPFTGVLGRRTYDYIFVPVIGTDGTVEAVAGTTRDITERKSAEERLEQTVAERTASLREAVEQMEEFSYSVSHDLRAPLRAINAYAGVLLEEYHERLDDTGRNFLKKIQRSSDRMNRLTQDVLIYSRVARAHVQLEPFSLERVINDVVHQYSNLQPPNAEIEVASPLLEVLGHEITFGQCVANLLTNAVKFISPGVKPHVRIWTERRENNVRVWFEDNGIGIKPEHQKRIFQMFERIHPDGKYEGTGIGLTIVRKVVEKMGGSVGVESNGQNGSRFWVELRSTQR